MINQSVRFNFMNNLEPFQERVQNSTNNFPNIWNRHTYWDGCLYTRAL